MYNIRFFLGLPHSSPRQEVATAVTMHDDPDKAFAEAKAKAQFLAKILDQQLSGRAEWQPPVESDEDYVDGRLSEAACKRIADERLLELMGPHPLPSRDVKKHLPPPVVELQMTSDDGQITLIDIPAVPLHRMDKDEWHPSGDYRAEITLKYGPHFVSLGGLEFASTTASRALSQATESARQVVATLKKDPKLGFISFANVRIQVERINTQISLVEDKPDFDWRHMEYPAPRF